MESISAIADVQKIQRRRILLFPLPFQGHINPMIQLAHILHSKGFSIFIVHTKFNFPDQSKYPHFTFHLIPDALSQSQVSLSDPIQVIKTLFSSCSQPFYHCLSQLCADDDGLLCLITDAIWSFTQDAADKFHLPRIVLRTSNISSFIAFAAFPLLREKGYLSIMDSNMDGEIEDLPPLKVKDIPLIETKNPEDLYEVIESMMAATKKASCLIFNTFQELEGQDLYKLQQQFLVPTFAIGPFHKYFSAASSSILTQDRSSVSWLDKQAPKSVLYVSFGSIAAMNGKDLLEVAWGLADSMQAFLWVVRPGLVEGAEWLEMLPNEFLSSVRERSHIVKWAPQQEVLSHPSLAAFWTHCGWNSTLEAVCEGVPMICSPFFGDQMVNSRYVNDVWKIGIKLERGMKRGEIGDAIRRLVKEREGEEIRERIECLKEKSHDCLTEGGSSYKDLDAFINLISAFH